MASANEQSNTLFNTSQTPQPDSRPVIVLDMTFSSAKLGEFLSKFPEWRVELLGKHFAHNCPDHVWIPDVAKRGWIIISADKAIRRSPEVCDAVQASHAKVFFMGRGGHRGEDYMAILGAARHRILRIAKNNAGPFFARIHQTTEVELVGLADNETKADRTNRKYQSGKAYKQFGVQKKKKHHKDK